MAAGTRQLTYFTSSPLIIEAGPTLSYLKSWLLLPLLIDGHAEGASKSSDFLRNYYFDPMDPDVANRIISLTSQ